MGNITDLYDKAKTFNNERLRAIIRSGEYKGQTAGLSKNMLQTNLIILEKKYALDFMIFCQRNPKACPLVGVSDVGVPFLKTLGDSIDVRTDVPSYNIYKNGKLDSTVHEIKNLWNETLIAFAIGCSFTFEHSLIRHGFTIEHINENKVVPMYKTNIKNIKCGPFGNSMVVSMRIFKKNQVNNVMNICKSFHWAHGKPIHYGSPDEIGILNISKPDWGDAPRSLLEDEVNIFWACGVTPQNAILNSSVPFCISHTPGYMLITDIEEDAEIPILQ